jgi:hypothetical protein
MVATRTVNSTVQIDQEMAKLKSRSQRLGTEIHRIYSDYITSLAQAVRHQGIHACYHICTNCYPAEFLVLEPSHQQRLQRSLRRAITNSVIDLLSQLQPIDQLQTPSELLDWQEEIEEAISHTLPSLSKKLNHLLQQARVIPQQVPRQVLEAAAKVEATGESLANRPHILKVLVEQDAPDSLDDTVVVPVCVIFLQLAEMEFADRNVLHLRKQIHTIQGQLANLHHGYQRQLQKLQVGAAEAAWHHSWFGSAESQPPADSHIASESAIATD